MSLPSGPYKPKNIESEMLEFWLSNNFYKPEYDPINNAIMSVEEMKQDTRDSWTLICPPPNAYGRPHIGNISGYAYMDAMARYQRMLGKKVLVLPGKDHAGLEGEGVFVREVLEKKKRRKFDMKREDFYQEMMRWMQENMQRALQDEQEIGLSADFDRNTFTLDPDIVDTVLDTFVEMYDQGMIYKGVRLVNWDPKARTAVADNQIEYKESQTPFFYFKYIYETGDEQRAIEIKNKYQGEVVRFSAIRNKTIDGENEMPFMHGEIEDGTAVIGVGYSGEDSGKELEGIAVGIHMSLDSNYKLIVLRDHTIEDLEKVYFDIFQFESKYYPGSHLIFFDDFPEDKYYKNGFVIGTVRPETIFADTAIACDPKDERYAEFVGKVVEVEFLGEKKKLNFISDYAVDKEFGTGLLKVTPAHSGEDWEISQRNPEACLPPIQVIGYDLRMNSLAGKYDGMKIKEAREEMIEDMKQNGNLVYLDETYENKIQIAERTKAPIEPLLSSQWYLKYDGIKEAAILMTMNAHNDDSNLEMSREGLEKEIEKFDKANKSEGRDPHLDGEKASQLSVTLHPSSMVPKFNYWMQNLRDWAISRSLWWGYRLPVWYHGEIKEEIGADGQVREMIQLSVSSNQSSEITENRELKTENSKWVELEYDNPEHIRVSKYNPGAKLVLIPGRYGFAQRNIFKNISSKFDSNYIHIPNIDFPSQIDYDSALSKYNFSSEDIVVAHSIGCQGIVNYLNKRNIKVKKLILLAPSTKNSMYFSEWIERGFWDFDESAKDIASEIVLIHSDNDETGSEKIDGFEELAELLEANRIQENGKKHYAGHDYDYTSDSLLKLLEAHSSQLSAQWHQDEAVLDTWFSSGQWVYATLEKFGLMDEFFPTDVMVSGFDILENWISRMMMFTYFKEQTVPFKHVYLTGLVKGTDGQKMSKSKGNLINIDDVREKYGTDAVRMVYYYQNSAGTDYAMTYDKLETFKRFVNKVWNASKFVLMNLEDMPEEQRSVYDIQESELQLPETKALFNHITETKAHITKNINGYEFGLATYNLYQSFWHEFADVHIEAIKQYVYTQKDKESGEIISEPDPQEKIEAQRVLLFTLKTYLKMLHPFVPFVTERIWQEIPKEQGDHESLMYSRW